MRKLIVCTYLLVAIISLPAAPAPDTAAGKTADDSWNQIADLKDKLSEAAQQGDPAAKSLVPEMQAALKRFEAKYPKDERVWGAKLLLGQIDLITGKMGLPGAPPPEKATQQLETLVADKAAPNEVRAQASLEIIMHSFPHRLDGPFDFDALAVKIATFQKDFGDFSVDGNQPAYFMLLQQELQMLKMTGNDARYEALLKSLATGSNPELAEFAQHGLAQIKKVAELKTKPFELTYTAVDGTKVDIAQLRGKVVLIDFWATWCGPCVAEMPDVLSVYQKYHSQGLEIIGVSLDQDKSALLAFTKQNGMTWPQFFDGGGFDNAISKSFDIESIPTMWLVDKKGMLVSTEAGVDLAGQVEKLLKAP